MTADEISDVLGLFRHVAPPQYWLRLNRPSGFRRRGIFCLAVVVWMMIIQRLQANGTLAEVVMQLRSGGYGRLLKRCKRVREGRISAATGGYCQARQKLSKLVVIQIVDELFARLQAVLREGWHGLQPPIFLLDGSTLRLEAEEGLRKHYPPARNQYGRSHWPVLRIAVAHDVESGLAVRPAWGAAWGAEATQRTEAHRRRAGAFTGGRGGHGRSQLRSIFGRVGRCPAWPSRAVAAEQCARRQTVGRAPGSRH